MSSTTTNSTRSDEIALLRLAKRDIASAHPASALAMIDEHARAFPRSAFIEEAEALRIEALVALGDTAAAHTAAERFHVAYPSSPYGHRVRSLTVR